MEDTEVATDMEVIRSLITEDMEADTEVITLIKPQILATKDLSRMSLRNETIESF